MKGYIIDCDYIICVKKLMKDFDLPFPKKKCFLKGDDELLPLILV